MNGGESKLAPFGRYYSIKYRGSYVELTFWCNRTLSRPGSPSFALAGIQDADAGLRSALLAEARRHAKTAKATKPAADVKGSFAEGATQVEADLTAVVPGWDLTGLPEDNVEVEVEVEVCDGCPGCGTSHSGTETKRVVDVCADGRRSRSGAAAYPPGAHRHWCPLPPSAQPRSSYDAGQPVPPRLVD